MTTVCEFNWPIARYRFEFVVETPLRLPFYAGSTLRGAFGRALRKIACMTKRKDCKSCPLYRECAYTNIFETPAPQTHELQKFSQVPNAYVIEPPAWGARIYEPGELLNFKMVLFGDALARLALVIYAMQTAFARDVGHGTARLNGVWLQEKAESLRSIQEMRRVLPIIRKVFSLPMIRLGKVSSCISARPCDCSKTKEFWDRRKLVHQYFSWLWFGESV